MIGHDTCSQASEPTWTVIPSQEEEEKKLEEVPIEVSSFQGEDIPETKNAQDIEKLDAAMAEAMMLAQMEQSTVSAFQPGSIEPGLDTLCDSQVARQLQAQMY